MGPTEYGRCDVCHFWDEVTKLIGSVLGSFSFLDRSLWRQPAAKLWGHSGSLWRGPYGEEQVCQQPLGVSLETEPSTIKPHSDNCSSDWQLHWNLMRDAEPEPSHKAALGFLTHGSCDIINMCCFKDNVSCNDRYLFPTFYLSLHQCPLLYDTAVSPTIGRKYFSAPVMLSLVMQLALANEMWANVRACSFLAT